MPDFRIFGMIAAVLIICAVILAHKKKFKYHKIVAGTAILFMFIHIAGAFGLYK
ncbi:MAG: hypothetical protein FWF00_04680 [Endomicrobia bacterium]|nr:hypothetical protein [Endomicrobiia bacterium]MCL2506966.1 hypothetical protein [Endomicrobiia bacterium]